MMKPLDRRVSTSGSSVEDEEQSGKLFCQPTPSGKHLVVDPKEMVYRTASVALLRGNTRYTTNTTENQQYVVDVKSGGPNKIFATLYKLWLNGKLCDVIMETADGNVRAHKIAMATYSQELEIKFSEYPEGEIVLIDMSDIKRSIIEQLVIYIYTSQITITEDNLVELSFCAIELGLVDIYDICMKELLRIICPENAYHFYGDAEKRYMEEIMELAFRFMATDFSKMLDQPEFSELTLEILVPLMNSNELDTDELGVFLAIVRWVDYSRSNRMVHAPVLLKCVRYQLIPFEDVITKVETVQWMFAPRENYNWLYEVMRFHALKGCGSQLVHSYPVQRSRVGGGTTAATMGPLVTPNYRAEAIKETTPTLHYLRMQTPDPDKAQDWPGRVNNPDGTQYASQTPTPTTTPRSPAVQQVVGTSKKVTKSQNKSRNSKSASPPPTPPTPPTAPTQPVTIDSVIALRNLFSQQLPTAMTSSVLPQQPVIIAIGGIDLQSLDPDIPGRFLYKYEPAKNEWRILTTMNEFIHHHGVANIDGKVYVVGGCVYDPVRPELLGNATKAVTYYDYKTRQWYNCCPMKECRSYLGVVSWQGKIYAIGGEDEDKKMLDSIEMYDPKDDTWTTITRMISGGKIGMSVAVVNDKLYIVGGYNKARNNTSILSHVECFDIKLQRWDRKRSLLVARCHANMVEINGQLYLAGGRTRNATGNMAGHLVSLTSVEVYDEEHDMWSHVADLQVARHDAGHVAFGPYLHVIGGVQTPHPNCLTSIECINVTNGQRVGEIASLPSPATGLACIQLSHF